MNATHPVVISPTIDAATIEATLWLITELRHDGHPLEAVADFAAEHLADMIAMHRAPADYDPTDADLAAMAPSGPSVLEQARGAWYLCAGIESGQVAS